MEQILGFLQPLLELYGGSQGWLVTAISIIGSLRVFVKPVMSMLLTYSTFTKGIEDDELYEKLESGNAMKTLIYILDWLASIKFKK